MATENNVNPSAASPSPKEANRNRSLEDSVLWRAFAALASPKLTVALLLAAIGIVMVGTLAQVHSDIWEVIDEYFRAWVCWVDFEVLFPASFFPWAARTDWDSLVISGFPFPGGALIGFGLVVNLTAALVSRFKVRARGSRLAWGLVVLAAGVVITGLVIAAGHNRDGPQGKPLLDWSTLWLLIRIGLVGLWLASFFGFVYVFRSVRRRRNVELGILGACVLTLGVLVAWIFIKGESATLSAASLRILYQLIQGEVAALLLLAGCVLLFRERAGSALLHGGVGLLMFGELFVSRFAAEQQITLAEGETTNYALDVRSVEAAIHMPFSSSYDDVVAVPMEDNGSPTRYARGKKVKLDDLPFDVEVLEYFKNSKLRGARAGEETVATQGVGTSFVVEKAEPKSGVDRGPADRASAYVKFTSREGGRDLGTFLLSQHFSSMRTALNTVNVDGKSYRLGLRYKRSYKPYEITLLDVRKDDYAGTSMARNYASRVRLTDHSRNIDFETKIWMNNPLRYAGETFYQSGYRVVGQGRATREVSTLQLVRNTGWMIPYVSCMIVATGIFAQFFLYLFRFLKRVQQQMGNGDVPLAELAESVDDQPKVWATSATVVASSPAASKQGLRSKSVDIARWLVPLAVVLLAFALLARQAVPPRSPDSQMQLEQFGSLPLMYEGRTKPFDTLARNSLRIISNRQTFIDDQGNEQPAIQWLLDVISRPELAEKHRVFRIDGLDLYKSLGLERRKGFRYSWEEIKPDSAAFRHQATQARQKDPQQRTLQQRQLMDLVKRLDRYRLLVRAFRPISLPPRPTQEEFTNSPDAAARTMASIRRKLQSVPQTNSMLHSLEPPLAVPAGPAEQPWLAYAAARNVAYLDELQRNREPAAATMQLAAIFEAYRDGDVPAFNRAVVDYQKLLADEPPAGLDAGMIRFEAYFNYFAPFYTTIFIYFPALLLTAFGWLFALASPRISSLLRNSAFWLVVIAFTIHTLALAARVMISGRPPVTNLYSSAVFIGWGCVGLGLFLEAVSRLGLGNFVASVLGIGTLIIAHFLAADGDTIRQLQAVLDTQFWLTSHVLTITLGYSAVFLAGALGLILLAYLLGKTIVFGVDYTGRVRRGRQLPDDWLSPSRPCIVERILGSMIFGTTCFAVFFSLVGTVLGGLWADDSWGRFWGWDPKENGALMIVLWTALVLHARYAGLVKNRGMALLAVGGNIVTSWAWFGVNELGVGKHSYGFTEGVAGALVLFWISQLVVIGLGIVPILVARYVRWKGDAACLNAEPS